MDELNKDQIIELLIRHKDGELLVRKFEELILKEARRQQLYNVGLLAETRAGEGNARKAELTIVRWINEFIACGKELKPIHVFTHFWRHEIWAFCHCLMDVSPALRLIHNEARIAADQRIRADDDFNKGS